MSGHDTIVAADVRHGQIRRSQQFVQQCAAARSLLSIDEADVLPGEVLNSADRLRIPIGDDEPCLPLGESNENHVLPGKLTENERHVEFTRSGIRQMRPGQMDLSLSKPIEGELTGSWCVDNFDAADPVNHMCEEAC